MINWLVIVRWVHILGGAAWLGEVATVVFVLIPITLKLGTESRKRFIAAVFPSVFRLATFLAIITLAAGATLNYMMTGWRNLEIYFGSSKGVAILLGGLLGLLLAGFHFTIESRIESRVIRLDESSDQESDRLLRYLRIIPKAGLVILIGIFILMMVGARGF